MALFTPATQEFGWSYSNIDGVRPSITSMGTTITSGAQPSYGSWTNIIAAASVTTDIYGIAICINNAFLSANSRQYLVDIGVDTSGGTSYSVKIPQLLGGNAGPCGTNVRPTGGIWYYFPLFIKAGSSIAARATGSTSGSFSVQVFIYGKPRYPEAVKAGSYVTAIGAVTSTSSGTSVTPGTARSDGSYTPGTYIILGTTTKPYWWWQAGYSCTSTTMSDFLIFGSVITSQGKKLVDKLLIRTSSTEQICTDLYMHGSHEVVVGEVIYGSLIAAKNVAGTFSPDSGTGMVIYGLGG
jgi:hypothetical protein